MSAKARKGMRIPSEHSSARRQLHELTHLPNRNWCSHCLKAKGKHGAPKKQLGRQSVIQVDYCFHSTTRSLQELTAVDVVTGLEMSVVVPSKGSDDYAEAELKKFMFECGRTFGILQYDQKQPLSLCTRVCAELGGLSIRNRTVP